MEHVEAAELIDRRTDRRLQTIRVGHVGEDRNGLIAGELRGFLARRAVNIGYRNLGALTCEQNGGGAADSGAGAGDECDLACKSWHLVFFRWPEPAR